MDEKAIEILKTMGWMHITGTIWKSDWGVLIVFPENTTPTSIGFTIYNAGRHSKAEDIRRELGIDK